MKNYKNYTSLRVFTTLGVLCAMVPALHADTRDDEIKQLRARIELLENTLLTQSELIKSKLATLEKRQDIADADLAADARWLPRLKADAKGMGISSADKAYSLDFKFLGQLDARAYLDKDGPPNRDQFGVRGVISDTATTSGLGNYVSIGQ